MSGNNKMRYQDYVKLRSKHMKQQGTTLTGSERMKQIANEWKTRGRGIAMAGGSFMDILEQLPKMIMGGELKGGELKMVGSGAKLNKLKKYALKIGLPLATAAALMALSNDKGIDVQSGFDSRNFQPFVDIELENNTPSMDEDKITGMGLKKKKSKFPHNMVKGGRVMVAKNKKQHDALTKMGYMSGEGFFSDIGDAVGGFFSNPVDAITKTAGMTLSALPFIL